MRPAALALCAALAAGCGDDGFAYQGTPGTPVPASFSAIVPSVLASVGDAGPRVFLVDTGSPITVVDSAAYPAMASGLSHVPVQAFALTFPDLAVARWPLFGDADTGLGGILGGDLLRHFALSLDYRGGRAWLSDPFTADLPIPDLPVGGRVDLPISVRGGGLAALPGDCAPAATCGTVALPATRITLRASFEGQTQPVWVVVDTGASAVLLSPDLLGSLGDDPPRPQLTGVQVSTVEGLRDATISRVWRLRLGGAPGDADTVEVDDLPVMTVPSWDLFSGLSAEVGEDVVALIGGTALRRYLTTVDYDADLLRLAPYTDPSFIPADEWIGVGFSLAASGAEWDVAEVYGGTDAEAEGIVVGDRVVRLGKVAITGAPASRVQALLATYPLGAEVPVGIDDGAGLTTHQVLVEDLLPSYPPPGASP